jgi:type IV secretion system protein VirB10
MSEDATIEAERTVAQVGGGRSFLVRTQRALAIGLAVSLGLAALTWYYVSLARHERTGAPGPTASARAAVSSETKLPPIAPAVALLTPKSGPPSTAEATGSDASVSAARTRSAPAPEQGGRHARSGAPLLMAPAVPAAEPAPQPALGELSALLGSAGIGDRALAATSPASAGSGGAAPVAAPAVATLLPTRRWLLPKGAFLDCTLETAIDSTLPGMATCILATDTYGADGRVVLLERGTKLIGETNSDIRAGQARVAVLWHEARTPTGVVVALASPGTDALGRAGVEGATDTHFGARFGSAILLSIIDGVVSGLAARRQGTGAVVYNAQGSRDIATEVLRNTITIPPTIRVPAGERVQVLVARDVDFRHVYRLASASDH